MKFARMLVFILQPMYFADRMLLLALTKGGITRKMGKLKIDT